MGFDGLLGNSRLKENLQASISRGHISHFYLISGPEGSGKKTLARLLSAAILCKSAQKPCLQCTACRKVMADTHPDLITVVDPEHKAVAVKIIRQIRDEMFVMPNEADKKIYILPQELNTEGQNALLKILEEPPEYGVYILLADNPETLLPTVRSRCTQLQLHALPESSLRQALLQEFPHVGEEALSFAIWRSGGFLGQAKALLQEGSGLPEQAEGFLRAFADGDALALVRILAPMEKMKRDPLIDILSQWAQLLQQALVCRSGMAAPSEAVKLVASRRSPKQLKDAVCHLQTAIEYAQGNCSPAAVCGWLAWVLR